ncbi:hypothetical protein HF263_31605 [Rhizobium leguminosarum]|uniref:hypothetical protein n=1 Tax=Rhizobium leguminosarum TaxID=384 RepID=UPI001C91151E|nr:hypothetical protein [Rhizobium leguminosarum]MBY2994216.1 hypothetical protein [Rhizobium leguminosarum]MBY3060553.1 hypothetical protein [Rhizobium leguminosarum]
MAVTRNLHHELEGLPAGVGHRCQGGDALTADNADFRSFAEDTATIEATPASGK